MTDKVKWLIQNNFIDDARVFDLVKTIVLNNGAVIGVNVIPFSDELKFVEFKTSNLLNFIPDDSYIVPYGSSKLTKYANKHGWKGCFYNEDTFDVRAWLQNRDDMLNQDAAIMTVDELSKSTLGKDEDPVFIRPCADLKTFNGTLTTYGQLKDWINSVDSGSFQFGGDTMVAVSPATNIDIEWRWFIVDGKVVTGSIYKVNHQAITVEEKNLERIEQAQKLADKWLPSPTCVMDTAMVKDQFKVIEFNTFNSSGLYKHDVDAIVKAVHAMVLKEVQYV